jgi:hypothetical protein
MKNLSKVLFVFILLSMWTQAYAQNIIIRGGLNLSNMLMKDDDDTYSDDFKLKPGFHAGVTTEIPMNENLFFETGLLLSSKGYKFNESETYSGETYTYKGTASLLYLDIPLTAKAYFGTENLKMYGALGPYIGVGISGKSKTESDMMGETETEEEDVKWGSGEDDDLKRLDYGIIAGAGIELNAIQVGAFYSFGLANISSNTEGGTKVSNKVIGITVGLRLNSK